jgi:alpha-aminoadipic semialdehyde synthase
MAYDLGIRREDKNRWERRAPLAPAHVEELVAEHGRSVVVQPSPIRVFSDDEYRAAGAVVAEDLSDARVILGVKEIPPDQLLPGKPHLAFFHVIKSQVENMGMVERALEVGASLVDYEPIVDRHGRRLIFFGRHAGYAGMIDGLWALGQRLAAEGLETPFASVEKSYKYRGFEEAVDFLAHGVGREIRENGLPRELHPLVIGVTGGGNVSQGAQEVLDRLPTVEIHPDELAGLAERGDELSHRRVYKVVFRREHRVSFSRHLPHLTMLVNGIYWEPGTARLVTRDDVAELWSGSEPPNLRVIADLSCDVEGSVEVTSKTTDSGDPVYVVDPDTGEATMGVEARGPVVLAVDNLPAEFPRDASEHFGDSLFPFLAGLVAADTGVPFEHLSLPAAILGAVLTHGGELTPQYRYLEDALEVHRAGSDTAGQGDAP